MTMGTVSSRCHSNKTCKKEPRRSLLLLLMCDVIPLLLLLCCCCCYCHRALGSCICRAASLQRKQLESRSGRTAVGSTHTRPRNFDPIWSHSYSLPYPGHYTVHDHWSWDDMNHSFELNQHRPCTSWYICLMAKVAAKDRWPNFPCKIQAWAKLGGHLAGVVFVLVCVKVACACAKLSGNGHTEQWVGREPTCAQN